MSVRGVDGCGDSEWTSMGLFSKIADALRSLTEPSIAKQMTNAAVTKTTTTKEPATEPKLLARFPGPFFMRVCSHPLSFCPSLSLI